MRFGLHERLDYPARYLTMLRDPVRRFISYFHMLQRMGIAPSDHQLDPRCSDWNLRGHETLPRELDNGQVRALANADWDLPFGACSEEHLKIAQANLDQHFSFVGMSEHFDLSVLLLKRLLGWNWHFYVPKNISPEPRHGFSARVLDAMAQLNRFDRQLCEHATEKLFTMAEQHGLSLHLEQAAFAACNFVHGGKHRVHQFLKTRLRRLDPPEAIEAVAEPRV